MAGGGSRAPCRGRLFSNHVPARTRGRVRGCTRHRRTQAVSTDAGPFDGFQQWLIEEKQLPVQLVKVTVTDDRTVGNASDCVAVQDVRKGQEVCSIPQDLAITAVDARQHPSLQLLCEGRSELTCLALLLLESRRQMQQSSGSADFERQLLALLPEDTLSPVLWPDGLRKELLRGSPVLEAARQREAEARSLWSDITAVATSMASAPPSATPAATARDAVQDGPSDAAVAAPEATDMDAGNGSGDSGAAAAAQGVQAAVALVKGASAEDFLRALCVVVKHAVYLPSAQCFAVLPMVSFMRGTGAADGAVVDFDEDQQAVLVRAQRDYAAGASVLLADPRPNGERVLSTGSLERGSEADYLEYVAELVRTERLFSVKKSVVEGLNLQTKMTFPLYLNRFPIQLLNFMRLARIQDVAQMATLAMDTDKIISPQNEYEVLQLVMAEVRERLQAYAENQEDDVKLLQQPDLTRPERLAATLRLCEKEILQSTTDAIRRRLAPIRGIPTKAGGLQDPNADLLEIFETIEAVGSAPQRLWGSLSRWARGEQDKSRPLR